MRGPAVQGRVSMQITRAIRRRVQAIQAELGCVLDRTPSQAEVIEKLLDMYEHRHDNQGEGT